MKPAGLQFRVVDAKEQVVGRLAAQVSVILQAISTAVLAPGLPVHSAIICTLQVLNAMMPVLMFCFCGTWFVICHLMQCKDKVEFAPHLDNGDVVVVKNARHIVFTGKKWKQKLYRHHTG